MNSNQNLKNDKPTGQQRIGLMAYWVNVLAQRFKHATIPSIV
jgi:hypothetical protein